MKKNIILKFFLFIVLIISSFFLERNLVNGYVSEPTKILIVPGHDNEYRGAEFGNLKESDINIKLAKYLFDYFKNDIKFKTVSTREFEDGEYSEVFQNYFKEQEPQIISFMNQKRQIMSEMLEKGDFERNVIVEHNPALPEVALRLYGINKWANENEIDLSLHIHFNDYPGRRGEVGKYSGFSIYIPDKQYSNFSSSLNFAKSIFERLKKYNHPSDFPLEEDGIIESQELIALGSNNSQSHPSVLVEYGYLYEDRFSRKEVSDLLLKEFAYQTYLAVKDIFEEGQLQVSEDETGLLPFNFTKNISFRDEGMDVLSLQLAMLRDGVYPPEGKTFADCPLSGLFGSCTRSSVKVFQEKYAEDILRPLKIEATGFVGAYTLRKLNSLYGLK